MAVAVCDGLDNRRQRGDRGGASRRGQRRGERQPGRDVGAAGDDDGAGDALRQRVIPRRIRRCMVFAGIQDAVAVGVDKDRGVGDVTVNRRAVIKLTISAGRLRIGVSLRARAAGVVDQRDDVAVGQRHRWWRRRWGRRRRRWVVAERRHQLAPVGVDRVDRAGHRADRRGDEDVARQQVEQRGADGFAIGGEVTGIAAEQVDERAAEGAADGAQRLRCEAAVGQLDIRRRETFGPRFEAAEVAGDKRSHRVAEILGGVDINRSDRRQLADDDVADEVPHLVEDAEKSLQRRGCPGAQHIIHGADREDQAHHGAGGANAADHSGQPFNAHRIDYERLEIGYEVAGGLLLTQDALKLAVNKIHTRDAGGGDPAADVDVCLDVAAVVFQIIENAGPGGWAGIAVLHRPHRREPLEEGGHGGLLSVEGAVGVVGRVAGIRAAAGVDIEDRLRDPVRGGDVVRFKNPSALQRADDAEPGEHGGLIGRGLGELNVEIGNTGIRDHHRLLSVDGDDLVVALDVFGGLGRQPAIGKGLRPLRRGGAFIRHHRRQQVVQRGDGVRVVEELPARELVDDVRLGVSARQVERQTGDRALHILAGGGAVERAQRGDLGDQLLIADIAGGLRVVDVVDFLQRQSGGVDVEDAQHTARRVLQHPLGRGETGLVDDLREVAALDERLGIGRRQRGGVVVGDPLGGARGELPVVAAVVDPPAQQRGDALGVDVEVRRPGRDERLAQRNWVLDRIGDVVVAGRGETHHLLEHSQRGVGIEIVGGGVLLHIGDRLIEGHRAVGHLDNVVDRLGRSA